MSAGVNSAARTTYANTTAIRIVPRRASGRVRAENQASANTGARHQGKNSWVPRSRSSHHRFMVKWRQKLVSPPAASAPGA